MKKILELARPFILVFGIHFTVSLLFNWAFHESEPIGETIISSLLFAVFYAILCLTFRKKEG